MKILPRTAARLGRLTLAAAGAALSLCGGPARADGPAPAKNVIFFLGDGMGPATVTAARIYRYGESGHLHFESLPRTARIRTHSRDAQTTDSAPSMSAYMTGVKMNNEVLSMSPDTVADLNRCGPGNGAPVRTLLELAKAAGKGTGVVTTTRLTHATPAATYAHICHRDLENDIAAQVVPVGSDAGGSLGGNPWLLDGVDVLLGGGRRHFLPQAILGSKRTDARDLTAEMTRRGYRYVEDRAALLQQAGAGGKLLGLFTMDHMSFELDRDFRLEPSLAEMTRAAIDRLSQSDHGYFLMVEGGRIDHALHNTNAQRALAETIAFDDAVYAALRRVDLAQTLVVVTADHDHTMVINGYGKRGGPTLFQDSAGPSGKVKVAGVLGLVRDYVTGAPVKDAEGMPYAVLGFGNGERRVAGPRASAPALDEAQTAAPDYHQEAGVRRAAGDETHGGGDVMLVAAGPGSAPLRGTMDNTRVFQLVRAALGL